MSNNNPAFKKNFYLAFKEEEIIYSFLVHLLNLTHMNKLSLFSLLFLMAVSLSNLFSQKKCPILNEPTSDQAKDDLSLGDYVDEILASGVLILNDSVFQNNDEVSVILNAYNNSPDVNYQFEGIEKSIVDDDRVIYRYSQYYQGVKVNDGGYSLVAISAAHAIPDGPPPGPGCSKVLSINPSIYSNLNLQAIPSLSKTKFTQKVKFKEKGKLEYIEPVIYISKDDPCDYYYAYKAILTNNSGQHLTFFDSENGTLRHKQKLISHLNAPTQHYGVQPLMDTPSGNGNVLISNNRVRTYGPLFLFGSQPDWSFNTQSVAFTNNPTQWPNMGSQSTHLYQCHYIVSEIAPVFDQIGIVFDNIAVGSYHNYFNSSARTGPTLGNDAQIAIGRVSDPLQSMAHFDIVGHELTHSYIDRFMLSTDNDRGTIHEGVSDMIGTYVESLSPNQSLDWIGGDDVTTATIGRNLTNPVNNGCFSSFPPDWDKHERSTSLSYWFYLISTGNVSNNINIGIEKAATIVLDAIPMLNGNSTVQNFVDLTISSTRSLYGLCSPEHLAVTRAWNDVCIPVPSCDFSIEGPAYLCEENPIGGFDVSSIIPGAQYRWSYPPNWILDAGETGGLHFGPFLRVRSVPEYSSYPRSFTLNVYSPTLGTSARRRIIIKDCDGEDGCVFSLEDDNIGGEKSTDLEGLNRQKQQKFNTFIAYNSIGQILFQGSEYDYQNNFIRSNNLSGLVFITKFFNDKVVSVEKVVIIKH